MLRHKCKKMITSLYHLLQNSENLKEEWNGRRNGAKNQEERVECSVALLSGLVGSL